MGAYRPGSGVNRSCLEACTSTFAVIVAIRALQASMLASAAERSPLPVALSRATFGKILDGIAAKEKGALLLERCKEGGSAVGAANCGAVNVKRIKRNEKKLRFI